MNIRKAAVWSIIWVWLALVFCFGIYINLGGTAALTFLSGYIVEKLLSVDNLFMFYIIFNYFNVGKEKQSVLLSWGIIGAAIFRASLIFSGAAIVSHFNWLLYVFGAFLLYTSYKLALTESDDEDQAPKKLISRIKRFVPGISTSMIILLTIEITDVLFALDSIPAIFGITTDPFLIYTSNIFAILGLRSMYFLLLHVIEKFHYLQSALAVILGFIAIKMLGHPWINISILQSFSFIITVMLFAIGFSIRKERQQC